MTSSSSAESWSETQSCGEDVLNTLLHHVSTFSDALQMLSQLVDQRHASNTTNSSFCVRMHEAVADLSRLFKQLLRYSFIKVPALLAPMTALVQSVKELRYDNACSEVAYDTIGDAIHQVQTVLAERLRAYMMGDYLTYEIGTYIMDPLPLLGSPPTKPRRRRNGLTPRLTQSEQDLSEPMEQSSRAEDLKPSTTNNKSTTGTFDELDGILIDMANGIDVAFDRAKVWSKYCRDIETYIMRRIELEDKHAKQLTEMAEQMRSVIGDKKHVPLQGVFVETLRVETEYGHACATQLKQLYEVKCVKRLEKCRLDQDRKRKSLQNEWDMYQKRFQDLSMELRKAKQALANRDLTYKRARDAAMRTESKTVAPNDNVAERAKVERKRRLEEDALIKRETSLDTCRNLETKLEERREDMERQRGRIIGELRELLLRSDQTAKACTVYYFSTLNDICAIRPLQYHSLADKTRQYVPGSEYADYLRTLKWEEDEGDDMYDEDMMGANSAANSHTLKRKNLPTRCHHCQAFTFMQTVQCDECLLVWHRGCVPVMETICGAAPKSIASRRMSIFGVPLASDEVPFIVRECVEYIERENGLRTKGLYRVSGVKSRIEYICGEFENERALDLSDESTTNIASVLKLYIRQLPTPLLTSELYTPYIQLAKSYMADPSSAPSLAHECRALIERMPKINQMTLRFLLLHWRRLMWFESDNLMTASNMGVVLAPTLMENTQVEKDNPLKLLVDAPLQAKVVELLLETAYSIYEIAEENEYNTFVNKYGDSYGLTQSTSQGTERQSATPDLLKSHNNITNIELDDDSTNIVRFRRPQNSSSDNDTSLHSPDAYKRVSSVISIEHPMHTMNIDEDNSLIIKGDDSYV